MPRTPLFSQVQRALQLARAALHTPYDPAELVERAAQARAARRLSRREFLASSAGLGAALLAGCAPPRAGAGPRPREPVLIVGAGIAGLTAAHRLRQAGVPVRVFEAQDRVGGRIFSLRHHFADGQVAELGGELIDTGHTHVQALARELGLELDDLAQEAPGLATDLWFFGGQRRSDAEVVAAFRPLAARIEAELAGLGGDGSVSYRAPNGAERLDRLSLAEWLHAAGARGWMRDLLDVAYTTEYGLEIGEQSALNFLVMIDPQPEPFRVFGESDERFHVRGGNDQLPARLAERLADAIETGTVLEAVAARPGGGFRCSFRRGEGTLEAQGTHLLLALPFTLLREVRLAVELPPAKRRAIRELGYGTNAKLMLGFRARPWRQAHGSNGSLLTDLPLQLTWETSRRQPGVAGILTNFTGGAHGVSLGAGTPRAQAEAAVRDLERVFPGVAAARDGMTEARFHWPSHPWTRGSYACYRPGQWTAFAGAEGEAVGMLFFAGEHCSGEAQGFMEGGCETGEAAAAQILESLGRRAVSRAA